MKTSTFLKNSYIDIISILLLLPLIFTLGFLFYQKKTGNNKSSIKVISNADALILANSEGFKIDSLIEKNTASNNQIEHKYLKLSSLESFQNNEISKYDTIFNLKLNELNITPKIIDIRINRVKVAFAPKYDLSTNTRLISLKFTDLLYHGRKLKYQFALSQNEDYQDFGSENTLNIHLPIGSIKLYIKAIDIKSKTITKPFTLTFNSDVIISKKPWFWPLNFATFLIVLFLLFYRKKISKKESLLNQKLALEQQRSKIIADLHDEIGASMSSLQINSLVASKLITSNPKEAKEVLNKIEWQSRKLAESLGDLIWSMKPGKEEFIDFGTKIKNFANDILGSSGINYEIKIDKDISNYLSEITIRKNLISITKEAINNAAKYSKASELRIDCHKIGEIIQLEIKDNGVGFNRNGVNGNGIKNIESRVKELNGVFDLTTSPNEGCQILISIPLSLDLGTK